MLTETPECRIHTKTVVDAIVDDLNSHVDKAGSGPWSLLGRAIRIARMNEIAHMPARVPEPREAFGYSVMGPILADMLWKLSRTSGFAKASRPIRSCFFVPAVGLYFVARLSCSATRVRFDASAPTGGFHGLSPDRCPRCAAI